MEGKRTKNTLKPSGIAIFVALVAVVVVVLAVSSNIVRPKDNTPDSGTIDPIANGVLGEPADTLDVVFIGDSEAAASFSPLQMWDQQGFTSYVCFTPGQQLHYANTILHRALENQQPKVVVFETDMLYTHFSIGDVLVRAASDVLPVFEYHDRWKNLTPEDFSTPVKATWTDPLKGYKFLQEREPADDSGYMAPTDEAETVPLLNRLFMKMMVDYCRERGSDVVFVSVPSTVNWSTAKHNGARAFADELGVDYVDMNTGDSFVKIDWAMETHDAGDHLNKDGAVKTSSYFGEYLSDAYGLPDHRDDAAYENWNDALASYFETTGIDPGTM